MESEIGRVEPRELHFTRPSAAKKGEQLLSVRWRVGSFVAPSDLRNPLQFRGPADDWQALGEFGCEMDVNRTPSREGATENNRP